MKKKWPVIASIAASVTGASIAALGYTLSNKVMYIKRKDQQFIFDREIAANRFKLEWYESVPKEDFLVSSINGYDVSCQMIHSVDSKNTVIIAHGVTETHINSLKYAALFARLGYNIVVYDQRRHGATGGKTTSYGFYEKNDLKAVVEEVRRKIGDDAILGIQGESMGAATALQYGGTSEQLFDFIIADCPFSKFEDQLQHLMVRDTPLRSPYAIKFIDYFVQMRDGYNLKDVSPIDVVQNITKPILFVTSLEDTYIPPKMTEDLYEKHPENSRLVLFEKGAHAKSFNEQPYDYEKEVLKFLVDFNISYVPNNYVNPEKMLQTQ